MEGRRERGEGEGEGEDVHRTQGCPVSIGGPPVVCQHTLMEKGEVKREVERGRRRSAYYYCYVLHALYTALPLHHRPPLSSLSSSRTSRITNELPCCYSSIMFCLSLHHTIPWYVNPNIIQFITLRSSLISSSSLPFLFLAILFRNIQLIFTCRINGLCTRWRMAFNALR